MFRPIQMAMEVAVPFRRFQVVSAADLIRRNLRSSGYRQTERLCSRRGFGLIAEFNPGRLC